MSDILIAGVSPEWLKTAASKGYDIGERNQSSKIQEAAGKLAEDLKAIQKTNIEKHFLVPDDSDNWDQFLVLLKSRKWDCIAYGGGARTIPELTDYFTDLVNLTTQEQPGAKLVFPLLPQDVIPAIKKYFPNIS